MLKDLLSVLVGGKRLLVELRGIRRALERLATLEERKEAKASGGFWLGSAAEVAEQKRQKPLQAARQEVEVYPNYEELARFELERENLWKQLGREPTDEEVLQFLTRRDTVI